MPKHFDLYKFNDYCQRLYEDSQVLIQDCQPGADIFKICQENIRVTKRMHAAVIHVQTVMEHILTLDEEPEC